MLYVMIRDNEMVEISCDKIFLYYNEINWKEYV